MESFNSSFFGTNINLSKKCYKYFGSTRNGSIYEESLIRNFYNEFDKTRDEIVLFDIGTNTGSFCFLPIVDNKIKTYCFEPNPRVYEILLENLKLNNLENSVKSFNIGLSNVDEKLSLKIPIDTIDSGLSTFGETPLRFRYDNKSGEYEVFEVDCKKLDTVVNEMNLKKIDYIKIDTEGSERNILLGAEETLKEYKPSILMEFETQNTSQFGYEREELIELLKSYGYKNFKPLTPSDIFVSF